MARVARRAMGTAPLAMLSTVCVLLWLCCIPGDHASVTPAHACGPVFTSSISQCLERPRILDRWGHHQLA